jgi:DNA-binding NarL/FixJ family response regulator
VTARPRCLVADDHPALLAAICDFVESVGFDVVGPAGDGRRTVDLAAKKSPDVGLVDFRMPRLSGTALLAELAAAAPAMPVVVYTAEADQQLARDILAAGARGLVLKEAPLADVGRALDAVLAGRSYVDPGVAEKRGAADFGLTKRELDVLALVADGLSHEEIGTRLGIGSETVRTHLRKASARLGAGTRTQAVAAALRLGLIA